MPPLSSRALFLPALATALLCSCGINFKRPVRPPAAKSASIPISNDTVQVALASAEPCWFPAMRISWDSSIPSIWASIDRVSPVASLFADQKIAERPSGDIQSPQLIQQRVITGCDASRRLSPGVQYRLNLRLGSQQQSFFFALESPSLSTATVAIQSLTYIALGEPGNSVPLLNSGANQSSVPLVILCSKPGRAMVKWGERLLIDPVATSPQTTPSGTSHLAVVAFDGSAFRSEPHMTLTAVCEDRAWRWGPATIIARGIDYEAPDFDPPGELADGERFPVHTWHPVNGDPPKLKGRCTESGTSLSLYRLNEGTNPVERVLVASTNCSAGSYFFNLDRGPTQSIPPGLSAWSIENQDSAGNRAQKGFLILRAG